jgi:hypothetical protein
MDAAIELIKARYEAEVAVNDGKPFAKIDGKPVNEFMSDWAQSETGKHFVRADVNSGGGSNGANGKGEAGSGQETITRSDFDALNPVAKAEAMKAGKRVVDE